MYKHILIATDGSDLATKGLKHGLELAKEIGASATIVTATKMWAPMEMAAAARLGNPEPIREYDRAAAASAKHILDAAADVAGQLGVKVKVMHIADMHPAEGILKAAADDKCDLIVIASHGRRGINRLLLGSVAMEVVTQSTIPTLVVR